ncbi:MAG: hypothetical protein AUJ92_09210 [Armatimonadetes bacterium CG2_30_59_28]|nr:polysaccharide deacetylase family protein [Armatimonadota bacterium]OIO94803.1 MAG: hypothetical protein AUJ92_09210 [Armatimonadetes bacterium CG2_30_59_28]PIU66013.1 MAG: polysaccharide deacetylase family protein [Armatimonadetes bacterium CG07_land_8_20_14_0_80_59_28]PIX38804.1 MAG: polysaccharide deacetylase family protein [Armatimonadetes bacterium CG_4_8_14_3_um_filter_58_9]PIY48171.1 MAG: polysaccharide deacetylase family protein [Armatimonadetes bacterium CG_4_10_14_3_um_filter_59_10
MFAGFERIGGRPSGVTGVWWKASLCIIAALVLCVLSEEVLRHFHVPRTEQIRDQHAQAIPLPKPADPRIPSRYYGKVIRSQPQRHVGKEICLTFDDGPSATFTPEVLDILRAKRVSATFFVVGKQVARYPEIIRQAHAEGHVIGNHSWNHIRRRWMGAVEAVAQVDKTAWLIEEVTGTRPTMFRPPFGRVKNYSMANVARFRYNAIILWTIDSRDSAHATAPEIQRNCLNGLRSGDILLFHDGVSERDEMVKALPLVIDAARGRGFRFVTVPEMLREMEAATSP